MFQLTKDEGLRFPNGTLDDDDQEKNEERFGLILDAMQDKAFPPQKVFYGF